MTGFRIEPTAYRLRFDDTRLSGFEVIMKSVSIAEFLKITGLSAGQATTGVTLKDDAVVRDPLLQSMAPLIAEWNLEDAKGKPVKPGYEALAAQEPWVVRAIAKGWLEAVSGVSPNSVNGSSSQDSSLESSIPMEL